MGKIREILAFSPIQIGEPGYKQPPMLPPPIRRYFVADLTTRGDVRAVEEYRYEQLEQLPGAAELITHFATLLWRDPQEFETTLPHGRSHMTFRWHASATTAGISTLRLHGELASLGLLASGLEPDADKITLAAFQTHLLRELHDTPYEPSFGLLEIEQRPLIATMSFIEPTDQMDQLVLALADRCFAAAYFRYQNLA
jgi:hypothetical protein